MGTPQAGQDVQVDCRGDPCPGPIFKVAKVARAAKPGARLVVFSDDDAFPKDIEAWCRATGNTIQALEQSDHGVWVARIIKAALQGVAPATGASTVAAPDAPRRENKCTLLVLHSDFDSLLAAFSVAHGALSLGMDVALFFSFWGVNALRGDRARPDSRRSKTNVIQKAMKRMMPKGARRQKLGQMHMAGMGKGLFTRLMKAKKMMSIDQMFEALVEEGARFIVCTTSMEIMGVEERDLLDLPKLVMGGAAAFVDEARTASLSMVF